MRPSSIGFNQASNTDRGFKQNFFTVTATKGVIGSSNFATFKEKMLNKNLQSSRTPSNKKTNTGVTNKNFGRNIVQSQIGKVRVNSGCRIKPGVINYPNKHLKNFLADQDQVKRKNTGGSHSRNHVFQIINASNIGKSYNKSATRGYSPNNASKSPKNKKSRNSRITGSYTYVATKRRQSKKYSRDQDTYRTVKNADKNTKKDSIFLMYHKYPRMTKNTLVPANARSSQFNALSPKTVKNMIKLNSGISGIDKYQTKANPSKKEIRGSSDREYVNYFKSLASEGTKSKEDLRYVPVENISLFDYSNAPLSARNPKITGSMKTFRNPNVESVIQSMKFFKNFKFIKVFKQWSGYCRKKKYLTKRQQLANSLPWTRPYFSNYISSFIEPLNEVRFCSPLLEIKAKNIYDKKYNGHEGFIIQCSQRQKQTLVRIDKKLNKMLRSLNKLIKFKHSLARNTGRWKNERAEAIKVIDKAINFMCIRSVFCIIDLIRNQQNQLFKLFTINKDNSQAKFNFEMDFDHNGNVVTNPTFEEYTIHAMNLYNSLKKVVVDNKGVQEF